MLDFIPSNQPRPTTEVCSCSCDYCGSKIEVTLEWWKDTGAPNNGDYWIKNTIDEVPWQDRLCASCLDYRLNVEDNVRTYTSNIPPSWFDPSYAGERWDDEY
jgi:hypothetical protein